MIHDISQLPNAMEHSVLRSMFEARKRVFIDLLGWDVPSLAGRYELDQFDTPDAKYIVLADSKPLHRASARLLPTEAPHLLDSLFPWLCENGVPRGPHCQEISRFCLDPRLSSAERRAVRDELVHALVEHALANGITHYTGIAEEAWLKQILVFGWRCRPLGPIWRSGTTRLGALIIEIDEETQGLLERGGVSPIKAAKEIAHVH
ncbi:acyl-homoserine-lactone synthase [Novosphingobium sp. RL4]|uniref:acyl-homoserine-lactone synthase n=1 Tax=Novosphingobium sp. RL4 TaxID=3109595 RepID=UPI002D78BBCD|nr:acyl-homoserine-lactone synthase [Novosphingobium sp. RL4]WRT94467.1 acyl-homoserine-lactone synthase [Novosphingobium sp. RL4]